VIIRSGDVQAPGQLVFGAEPEELQKPVGGKGIVVGQGCRNRQRVSAGSAAEQNRRARVGLIDTRVAGEDRQLVAPYIGLGRLGRI
jgi:hypothetical protein